MVERGDGSSAGWLAVWASAEQHYFTHVCPPAGFDLHVTSDDVQGPPGSLPGSGRPA